ncbi:MAG: hypothetical protein AAF570_29340, partial [Bacteroidota bacterium]
MRNRFSLSIVLIALIGFLTGCGASKEDMSSVFQSYLKEKIGDSAEEVTVTKVALLDSVFFREDKWMKAKQNEIRAAFENVSLAYRSIKAQLPGVPHDLSHHIQVAEDSEQDLPGLIERFDGISIEKGHSGSSTM